MTTRSPLTVNPIQGGSFSQPVFNPSTVQGASFSPSPINGTIQPPGSFTSVIPLQGPTTSERTLREMIVLSGTDQMPEKKQMEMTVEEHLLLHGYVVIDRFVMANSNGYEGKYVKASTPIGEMVFIELDMNSSLQSRLSDLTVMEVGDVVVEESSQMMTADECSGLDVCGVAFECADGICTLKRDERLKMRETSFVIKSKRADEEGMLVGNVRPYPIVKMSEIEANPAMVLQYIVRTNQKLTKKYYDLYSMKINNSILATECLHKTLCAFKKMEEMKAHEIGKDLACLHKYLCDHKCDDSCKSACEKKKVVCTLRKRNAQLLELMRCMKKVSKWTSDLPIHNEAVNLIIKDCECNMIGMGALHSE